MISVDYKKEAIEMLKGLKGAKSAMRSIPEELERVELKLTGIRSASADGAAVQGGGSGREDALLTNMVRKEKLHSRLKENELWISQVERALSCLEETDRLVLDRMYIQTERGNVERLCEELCVEKSTVYYKRDNALRNFTRALYGFEAV